jgi:glycolate permease/lactate permease
MIGVFPAVLVAGVSFAAAQFVVSNMIGPELTDTIAALCSIGALALLLRVWRPSDVAATAGSGSRGHGVAADPVDAPGRVARAFATYGILVVVVLVGQSGNFGNIRKLPPPANVTALLRCGQSGNTQCPDPWVGESVTAAPQGFRFPVWDFQWPGSYAWSEGKPVPLIRRAPPVAADVTPYPLTYRLDFLASAGTLVFIAGVIAFVVMLVRGVPRSAFGSALRATVVQLRLPVVTIAFILSISTVMNYSGMTSSMALALASTGWLFPFFSAFLGMLGVFLTGSDTSSNTLFGPLQATTAKVSGLDPILMGATNSSGGVMGKMISPQNLSVGAAGVGAVGREGEIFRRVVGHSLILTALMGLLAMLQAYVLRWMVPS